MVKSIVWLHFDLNSVIIASLEDIVIRRVPVVIAYGGAGPKRVAVILGNKSGGYYWIIKAKVSLDSSLHDHLILFEVVKNASNKEFMLSSMFITGKVDGQGDHSKWKARVVAGDQLQEKKLFSNNSSSTINADAVKCIFKLLRKIMVINVTAAYLHAATDQEFFNDNECDISSTLLKA